MLWRNTTRWARTLKQLWREIRVWLLLVALFFGLPALLLALAVLTLIDWRILPAVIIGIVAFSVFGQDVFERRTRRRRDRGLCLACGYNLTGNVSGICPECGIGAGR
jgi:hypothetical protein